jgi:hypothetical protein
MKMTFLELLNDFSKEVAIKYGRDLGKGLLALRVSEELFEVIELESCTPGLGSDGKPFRADNLHCLLASGQFTIQKKKSIMKLAEQSASAARTTENASRPTES